MGVKRRRESVTPSSLEQNDTLIRHERGSRDVVIVINSRLRCILFQPPNSPFLDYFNHFERRYSKSGTLPNRRFRYQFILYVFFAFLLACNDSFVKASSASISRIQPKLVSNPNLSNFSSVRELEDEREADGEDDQNNKNENGAEDEEQQQNEDNNNADNEEEANQNQNEEEDNNQANNDGEQQDEKNKDEEQEAGEDGNDENQDGDQNEQEEMEIEDDDFFEDEIADDAVADYSHSNRRPMDDDFYAFIGDPAPPTLFPLETRYLIGYLISAAALTLGASGGIGGGGIVVPVYLLVMGLGPKAAMGVGSVTILGGTFSSTLLNTSRRHPLADRPLIDWDLIMVMQPVVLVGVFLGTFIHQLVSEQVLIVLLVILLSVTSHTTLSKAMRMYRAENRYIRHLKAAQMEPPNGTPSRTFTWGDGASEESPKNDHERWMKDEEKQRILIENPDFVTMRSDMMEQEKFTPTSKIAIIICILSLLTVLNIAVGGGGYDSPLGIECGSASFWIVHVVMVGMLIVSTWAAQTYLIARHEIKNMVRFHYVQGDIRWNNSAGWLYPVFFMVAGLFAGMFGIGGGTVIVPLLLTLGTHPAVASSTSSAMVLMTSVVSSSTYYVFGLILFDFASVGFFCGFIFSFIGQYIMMRARQARSASGRRFERNSYIAFVIGGVVMVSAILMTIQYISSIVEGGDDDMGKLCDVRF